MSKPITAKIRELSIAQNTFELIVGRKRLRPLTLEELSAIASVAGTFINEWNNRTVEECAYTAGEQAHRWRLLQAQEIINCRNAGKKPAVDADGLVIPSRNLRFEDCGNEAWELLRRARETLDESFESPTWSLGPDW